MDVDLMANLWVDAGGFPTGVTITKDIIIFDLNVNNMYSCYKYSFQIGDSLGEGI